MRTVKVIFSPIVLLFACVASLSAQPPPVAVAPMHFRGLMPVIEVKLNGQGPFAFMIDTGSGLQADIDTSVAQRLKLQPTGQAINGDPSGANDRRVDTVTLSSISFGGAAFRDVTAIVRPHRITKDYPDVDGILGFALFTDYLLTLDYPAMQVRLQRGTLPPANGADVLNFELQNRIPVVELSVGKIRVRAHIDSGNYVAGFMLPEDFVEQLQLISQPVTIGYARSVTNRIELKQAQLHSSIHIGRFEYPQPVISFPALSNTNVGFKILREFALTFDQKNQRMKFERKPASD